MGRDVRRTFPETANVPLGYLWDAEKGARKRRKKQRKGFQFHVRQLGFSRPRVDSRHEYLVE